MKIQRHRTHTTLRPIGHDQAQECTVLVFVTVAWTHLIAKVPRCGRMTCSLVYWTSVPQRLDVNTISTHVADNAIWKSMLSP